MHNIQYFEQQLVQLSNYYVQVPMAAVTLLKSYNTIIQVSSVRCCACCATRLTKQFSSHTAFCRYCLYCLQLSSFKQTSSTIFFLIRWPYNFYLTFRNTHARASGGIFKNADSLVTGWCKSDDIFLTAEGLLGIEICTANNNSSKSNSSKTYCNCYYYFCCNDGLPYRSKQYSTPHGTTTERNYCKYCHNNNCCYNNSNRRRCIRHTITARH